MYQVPCYGIWLKTDLPSCIDNALDKFCMDVIKVLFKIVILAKSLLLRIGERSLSFQTSKIVLNLKNLYTI